LPLFVLMARYDIQVLVEQPWIVQKWNRQHRWFATWTQIGMQSAIWFAAGLAVWLSGAWPSLLIQPQLWQDAQLGFRVTWLVLDVLRTMVAQRWYHALLDNGVTCSL
jgi:hypothetical protein